MLRQLSFMNQLFRCSNAVCKSGENPSFNVTVTYFPHGKDHSPAWTHTDCFCEECTRQLLKRMENNPIIQEYNNVKIERM